MKITVNGSADDVSQSSTISDVLTARTLREDIVIVVLNGEITKRELWPGTSLNEGDNLEIIRVVGGG